jgi:hypothetical protein
MCASKDDRQATQSCPYDRKSRTKTGIASTEQAQQKKTFTKLFIEARL